eukprot:Gb_20540 [translate_table: standard]
MGSWVCLQQIYDIVVGDVAKGALEINWRDIFPYIGPWLPNKHHYTINSDNSHRGDFLWSEISLKKRENYSPLERSPLLAGHAAERRERATREEIRDNNIEAISGKHYHKSRYNGVGNV